MATPLPFEGVQDELRARWGAPPGGPFWDEIESAVRFGWEAAQRPEFRGRTWEEVEPDLQQHWYQPQSPSEEMAWDQVRDAVRLGWDYAQTISPSSPPPYHPSH